ncbi:MAG: hypothetical protein J6P72_07845 [Firmicutes bacterium]|nr:hypothetical protein [Bacillota bacterium]
MALTPEQMAQNYLKDKNKAWGALTFLKAAMKVGYDKAIRSNGIRYDEIPNYQAMNQAIDALTGDEELTQEEIAENFKKLHDNMGFFDRKVNGKTFRQLMTEHPVMGKALEAKLQNVDKLLGTGFAEPKFYRGDWITEEGFTQSAARAIKEIQDEKYDKKNPETYLQQVLGKTVSIMAARMISGCKANDLKTLEATAVNDDEIKLGSQQLMKNETFKNFLRKIGEDKDLRAKVEKAIGSGHGGGLDALFTEHLAKDYGPGEMPTDPELERYMPTALQRIEALQKMNAPLKQEIAAEIVALRTHVQADGTKASLNKKIPAGIDLQEEVDTLAKDKGFIRLANNPKVAGLLTKGHGGQMINMMRKNAEKFGMKPDAIDALNENSIGGRAKQIREEARNLDQMLLKKDFSDPRFTKEDVLEASGKLVTEYYILNQVAGSKPEDAPEKTARDRMKDLPAGKIAKHVGKVLPPLDQLNDVKAEDILGEISNKNMDSFFGTGRGETEAEKEMKKQGIQEVEVVADMPTLVEEIHLE